MKSHDLRLNHLSIFIKSIYNLHKHDYLYIEFHAIK